MHRWKQPVTAFLLVGMSVYAGRAIGADAANSASITHKSTPSPSDAKVLNEAADPFATGDIVAVPTPSTDAKSVQSTQINVSDSGTVEIHVNEANLIEVLRMLSLQSQKNIIASKDVRGTITANLYGVTVREALDAILHANGLAYREKGNFIYVYSAKEIAEMEKAERKAKTEVFRLFYTPAANAVTIIKPVLSAEAQVSFTAPSATGIQTGLNDLGGNSHATEDLLVVTDYPDRLLEVKRVLKEIDRRPQQILVEATILRAALTDDNALGVDFNVVGGVDFNAFTQSNSQITGGVLSNTSVSGSNVNSVGTGNNFSNQVNGGLKIGVVTNNVSMFLSALESVTDTVVLANPKVLALNKQKGEVIVGREDGYLTTTVSQTTSTQTVEFLKSGTRLIFRPFIADDGYVRMEIHPEDSTGGLTSTNLPFKITTEVTSNVMVKDGRTIVIGGLFREATDTSRSQVPVLGTLPGIGALFRQQKDHTQREEIIIMLTPHVVKDESQYADVSEEQLKKMNDLRVGIRKGLMFYGRERLAESAYENALKELNKPAPDNRMALWHLDIATNLNPKFTEAISLKERLTGQRVTSVDNSIIRDYARTLVAEERRRGPAMPTSMPASSEQPVAPAATQPGEAMPDATTPAPAQ